jgi:hypothetical protein
MKKTKFDVNFCAPKTATELITDDVRELEIQVAKQAAEIKQLKEKFNDLLGIQDDLEKLKRSWYPEYDIDLRNVPQKFR